MRPEVTYAPVVPGIPKTPLLAPLLVGPLARLVLFQLRFIKDELEKHQIASVISTHRNPQLGPAGPLNCLVDWEVGSFMAVAWGSRLGPAAPE